MELPPRTRRILVTLGFRVFFRGTTSAHAENTPASTIPTVPMRNYLRARGEYPIQSLLVGLYTELPPRTRRILVRHSATLRSRRTTSAHAENTQSHTVQTGVIRNYLRARGEYDKYFGRKNWKKELPPRTRRILHNLLINFFVSGTTSAHAENTKNYQTAMKATGNYLRARGEYCSSQPSPGLAQELPPRTRRIPWNRDLTPAPMRNYLRARGEYLRGIAPAPHPWELPPRTRRILEAQAHIAESKGTTSAHAENTHSRTRYRNHRWNYLRARGEYS